LWLFIGPFFFGCVDLPRALVFFFPLSKRLKISNLGLVPTYLPTKYLCFVPLGR
jgi:hypothetical protein